MGFFNWAAPAFNHLADRWGPEDIETIAGWLTPFVSPGGHLIDVGGGTGALGIKLAEALDARVTILDPAPEMIRYVPEHGSVEAVLGTAEEMPFENDSADAIIVTDAFHHFRDQNRSAEEMARVVRSGGGAIIIELEPRGLVMRTIVVAEKLLGEPGAFFTMPEMCDFFEGHAIDGTCQHISGVSYRFTGTVR